MKPHIVPTLCKICPHLPHPFSRDVHISQILLNSIHDVSQPAQAYKRAVKTCQLLPTFSKYSLTAQRHAAKNCAHIPTSHIPPLLNSTWLFLPLLNSCELSSIPITTSHLFSSLLNLFVTTKLATPTLDLSAKTERKNNSVFKRDM